MFRRRRIEGMYSVYLIKKTEQSETTLRHSAVRYSIFCDSLFKPDPAVWAIFLRVTATARECFQNSTISKSWNESVWGRHW